MLIQLGLTELKVRPFPESVKVSPTTGMDFWYQVVRSEKS